jgi:hypothetical protein
VVKINKKRRRQGSNSNTIYYPEGYRPTTVIALEELERRRKAEAEGDGGIVGLGSSRNHPGTGAESSMTTPGTSSTRRHITPTKRTSGTRKPHRTKRVPGVRRKTGGRVAVVDPLTPKRGQRKDSIYETHDHTGKELEDNHREFKPHKQPTKLNNGAGRRGSHRTGDRRRSR